MTSRKKGEIRLPDPATSVTKDLVLQGQVAHAVTRQKVDLVFVIDTTGSMSDKIQGILTTCADFLQSFSKLRLDYQVGIVAFGDLTCPGDRIVRTPFMSDLDGIRNTLLKIPRYAGGGNEGESSLEAMRAALDLSFRDKAVRVIVLITDEPALQHKHSPETITRSLQQAEVLTYVMSPPLPYFQHMARSTGGTWLEVTAAADFTSLLAMLRELANKMSVLVDEVHRIGHGSLSEYLKLKGGSK